MDVGKTIEEFNGLMDECKDMYSFNDTLDLMIRDKTNLLEEREKKIQEVKDYYDELLMKQDEASETLHKEFKDKYIPVLDGFKEIEKIIDVLTGVNEIKNPRYDDEDIEAACIHKLYFVDEMYDNDVMSLRAVIVGDNSFTDRIRNRAKYTLFVFGYVKYDIEESKRSAFFDEYFEQTENGFGNSIKYPYICFEIRTWDDVKTLVNYYKKNIKGLNDKRHEISELNRIIAIEKSEHERIEKIKSECSLEDFMPIFGYICPECGKDAVLKSKGTAVDKECIHCGEKLVVVGE